MGRALRPSLLEFRSQLTRQHKTLGLTLLELMLTLALVAIVGAIGVPAYRGIIERTDVNRAITDIGGISLDLHRWQTNTGFFPDSLAEAGLDGMLDPWGNPYAYMNVNTGIPGHRRKDHNLVPINTDFDLYSQGPDGRSVPPLTGGPSRDDIVRGNNGSFIGLATDY